MRPLDHPDASVVVSGCLLCTVEALVVAVARVDGGPAVGDHSAVDVVAAVVDEAADGAVPAVGAFADQGDVVAGELSEVVG